MEKLPNNQFQIIWGLRNLNLVSLSKEEKVIEIDCELPGMETGERFKIVENIKVILQNVKDSKFTEGCYFGEIIFPQYDNQLKRFYADTKNGTGHVFELKN